MKENEGEIDKKLNLPMTDFPMRSGLPDLEKRIIEYWNNNSIRDEIFKSKEFCKDFILHFGPPYSNGYLHIGHGFNQILKDLIVRSYNLLGYNINNYTGHDCHGLPIELAVKKVLQKPSSSIKEFITECNDFAKKYIDIQQNTMERLGILKEDGYYATFQYIKEIYEVFSKLLLKNLIYIDRKPCPWSITEKTVISDAEIVYRTKITKTVDLALQIVDSKIENLKGAYVCVWTTTPWTLIDNVAVAYNENCNYMLCEVEDKIIIISENVEESFKARTNINFNPLGIISGVVFKDIKCKHPILDHSVPLIHSDHVEKDSGTGFVHMAPAHGMEDFIACEKEGISLIESVDDNGYYYDKTPILGGKHIFRNEEDIFDALSGKILKISTIEHEYPYDTRGGDVVIDGSIIVKGTPLIYRATEQVFIDIHKINMEKLIRDINNLYTVPEILKKSLIETIQKRKEWCVSRNRILGVPTALFVNKDSGELLINEKLQNKILEQMSKDHTYFFKDESIDILEGIVDDKYDYIPKIYILDVWFDSGCVSYFLSKHFKTSNQYHQADVYIEGKDQVRGWFQSSLLLSYLLEEKLPYKSIVSHGFLVDEKGNKMSKSKGNVVDLEETINKFGVEILRLWVMSSDYSGDISISNNILNKCCEMYRKIRNVMRYLISVIEKEEYIDDFKDFHYLEQSILNEFYEMKEKYCLYLKDFSLRKGFEEIYLFILRISELYFNARKDTLYCDLTSSKERISSVQCIFILLKNLNILLTPILPSTSEEIFQYCKEKLGNNYFIKDEFLYKFISNIKSLSIEDLLQYILNLENLNIKTLKENGAFGVNKHFIEQCYFKNEEIEYYKNIHNFESINIFLNKIKELNINNTDFMKIINNLIFFKNKLSIYYKNILSIHEYSIDNIYIPYKEGYEIKSLDDLIEKIRKDMEPMKQNGEFNRNSDLNIHIKSQISQPLDVLEKLLGVLNIKIDHNIHKDYIIDISNLNLCFRCNRKSAKEHNNINICNRCKDIIC